MIRQLLDTNEEIIWEGKPDRLTYIIGSPVLYIFALFWGAFDFTFIRMIFSSGPFGSGGFGGMGGFGFFMVPFFLLHLMPVWIAIGGPIYRTISWHYVNYMITAKRVYIESGIVGRDVNIIEFTDIREPSVNVGVIERLRSCGTIQLNPYTESGSNGSRRTAFRATLAHIAQPYETFKLLKQMSLDIKSDIYYPNARRPEENPGYNTTYRPK